MNRVTRYLKLSSQIRQSHAKSLIGVVQCRSTAILEDNFEQNKQYIAECANRGASLVCLPEYFACIDHPNVDSQWNEPIDGPQIEKYRKLAVDNAVWLSLGGFQESITSEAINEQVNRLNHFEHQQMLQIRKENKLAE